LGDADPAVIAYAAETAGRLNQPDVLPALLGALRNWRKPCAHEGLAPNRVQVCVWLAYAPGAVLPNVREAQARQEVLELIEPLLGSPYPKVREVSVETLAATGLSEAVEPLALMIKKERKAGGFKTPNTPALVGRFDQRLKTLKKRKP
jgi:HEAT repeat protein